MKTPQTFKGKDKTCGPICKENNCMASVKNTNRFIWKKQELHLTYNERAFALCVVN